MILVKTRSLSPEGSLPPVYHWYAEDEKEAALEKALASLPLAFPEEDDGVDLCPTVVLF